MRPNADIVFLMGCGADYRPIIQALARELPHVHAILLSMCGPGDLRYKVCGYSDVVSRGSSDWWIEGPFTPDIVQAAKEMKALDLQNGGEGPDSLLDGLWKLVQMSCTPEGESADPNCWRSLSNTRRFLVIFSNGSFGATTHATHATQASAVNLEDVAWGVTSARFRIFLFAPATGLVEQLAAINRLEWEILGGEGGDSRGAMLEFASKAGRWAPQLAEDLIRGIRRAEARELPTKITPSPEIVALVGLHNEKEIARIRSGDV